MSYDTVGLSFCSRPRASDPSANGRFTPGTTFYESKRLLEEHIDAKLDKQTIYDLTWPTDPENWGELMHCLMKVEANLIACAQAVHALGDILAHAAYFAMGINLGPKALQEDKINLSSVEGLALSDPKFNDVGRKLQILRNDHGFIGIAALVNHSKHRGLIEPRLSVEPNDTTPYVMEFGAFRYRTKDYAERGVQDVLGPGYDAASKAVVDTGNAINAALA